MSEDTLIKLCGLRSEADVELAAELGANAVGFVVTPVPPRHLPAERIGELSAIVPRGIRRVGIFTNETAAEIERLMDVCRLNVAQVHREYSVEEWAEFEKRSIAYIPVFKTSGPEVLERLRVFEGREFLLDAFVKGREGGTGKVCDWDLAARAASMGRLILRRRTKSGQCRRGDCAGPALHGGCLQRYRVRTRSKGSRLDARFRKRRQIGLWQGMIAIISDEKQG